jgi:hypothetical protein
MPSPFPGMDPYLEDPDLFYSFHQALGAEFQIRLAPLLPLAYYAEIEPRIVYEVAISAPVEERRARPDAGVPKGAAASAAPPAGSSEPEITPPALEIPIWSELEIKLMTVTIRTVSGSRLVTSIEILSLSNKRIGSHAYRAYHRKRERLLRSPAHLMEIDLLRAGERPPLSEALPEASYFVVLSRAERRPTAEVWPIQLADRLPVAPVPLLAPDPDVPLDLGAAMAAVYQRAAYDRRLDYRRRPPAPPLTAAETAWLEERLRAAGQRPGGAD